MMDLIAIVAPFFALVVVGYGAVKFSAFAASGVLGLNRFVYFFALPALLFSKMAETPIDRVLGENTFLLAYLVAGLVVFALGWGVTKAVFRPATDEAAVMALAGCYGNIGFLGIPVLVAVLGGQAAAPLSLMLLIDVAFFIPFATTLIDVSHSDASHSQAGPQAGRAQVLRATLASMAKNPLILAIVFGLAFSVTGIGLPDAIGGFTDLLGRAAGPTAMFALGAVLAGRPMSEGMSEAALASALKLCAHPFVMWWAMTLFGVGAQWRLVATLGAATPVAAALFVIAQEHKAMPVRASTAVLVSTCVAMFSLPILIGWLR